MLDLEVGSWKTYICMYNMYLVAANDMDDDHHVGEGDEPLGPGERDEDVAVNSFAKGPVTDE